MARPLRIEFPGACYHVTARGNERKPIYRDERDRQRFLEILAGAAQRFQLVVHAYVQMRNHYHLLIETRAANLSRALRQLNGLYTQFFNRRHRRVGHLFQGRYTARLVEKDAYLLELSRYIHLNPVRVGEVSDPAAFAWSSAPAYVGGRVRPSFLCIDEVLASFGRQRKAAQRRYAAFLRDGMDGEAKCPWENVVGQTLLGSERWVEQMRRRFSARDRRLDVPATRSLPKRPTLDVIVRVVSRYYGITAQELCRPRRGRGTGARGLAMLLAYREGGLTQAAIAAPFGVTYFAVSRAIAAQRQRLAAGEIPAKALAALIAELQT